MADPAPPPVWLQLGALGPRRVRMNDDGTLPKLPFGLWITITPSCMLPTWCLSTPSPPASAAPPRTRSPTSSSGSRRTLNRSAISSGSGPRATSGARAQIPLRRKLWRLPRRRPGGAFALALRHVSERPHPRLGGRSYFATLNEGPGNDLPYLIFLPAFTSIAHYHKRLPPDLQADLAKARAEAREFVRAEYPAALLQGAALPSAQRSNIVAELYASPACPASVIEENDLRVDSSTFRKMLLHDQGLILAHRTPALPAATPAQLPARPASIPPTPPLMGRSRRAMNSYLRQELKVPGRPALRAARWRPAGGTLRRATITPAWPAGLLRSSAKTPICVSSSGQPVRPGLPDRQPPLQHRASPA